MAELSDLNVSNVFLYIADAVRWDSLPKPVAKRGRVFKTISAGIHTPTSFASIVSGLHPPQHGVRQFGDILHDEVPSLFSLENTGSRFANTINEKFNDNPESESILGETLATSDSSPDSLRTIEEPFVFVERGPGGHAPYGEYTGNGWEYYRDRKAAPASTYREEYREGVNLDCKHFESRIEHLERRNLLDDTLIIYTSDHGELLGEAGCLGHNAPIHPKLVYVPSVFINPSLENQKVTDGIFRHVDFLPTITALQEMSLPELPGRDLTSETLSDQGACFYRKAFIPDLPVISGESVYESVWDTDGGYVYSRTGRLNQATILFGKLMKSAKREYMRRHLQQVVPFYLSGNRRYGTPRSTPEQGREYLEYINNLPKAETITTSLGEASEERLRELGYL